MRLPEEITHINKKYTEIELGNRLKYTNKD